MTIHAQRGEAIARAPGAQLQGPCNLLAIQPGLEGILVALGLLAYVALTAPPVVLGSFYLWQYAARLPAWRSLLQSALQPRPAPAASSSLVRNALRPLRSAWKNSRSEERPLERASTQRRALPKRQPPRSRGRFSSASILAPDFSGRPCSRAPPPPSCGPSRWRERPGEDPDHDHPEHHHRPDRAQGAPACEVPDRGPPAGAGRRLGLNRRCLVDRRGDGHGASGSGCAGRARRTCHPSGNSPR